MAATVADQKAPSCHKNMALLKLAKHELANTHGKANGSRASREERLCLRSSFPPAHFISFPTRLRLNCMRLSNKTIYQQMNKSAVQAASSFLATHSETLRHFQNRYDPRKLKTSTPSCQYYLFCISRTPAGLTSSSVSVQCSMASCSA